MKKIFLSLLALVGMAGGLLCTSCSGGAGKDKNGPARAVSGLILDLWPSMTPAFRMEFQQPIEANVSSVIYTAGSDNPEEGLFTIEQTGRENGGWVIRGVVHVNSSKILDYTDFKQAVGVPSDSEIKTINRFIIYFYFTADGKAHQASVYVDGSYGGNDGAGTQFSADFPRSVNFNIIQGNLNTTYLEDKEFNYNTVLPGDK